MMYGEKASGIVKDTETIARIRGIEAQMTSFWFFFGLVLGELLLRHTDNLSHTLQKDHTLAAEGQLIASMTTTALLKMRNDKDFGLFWKKVTAMAIEHNVEEPKLPRQCKRPKRFEEGAPLAFDPSAEDMYRRYYFEALDLIVQAIKDCFDQPGYRVYRCLESLLLKATKEDFSEELKQVVSIYGSEHNLQMQFKMLGTSIQSEKKVKVNIFDVRDYLQQLTSAERALLNEVVIIMKLILVMPATNVSSERSFSALRRVKSYLRSTMGLNHLMTLHVHKESTDSLNLVQIANEFVQGNESR